MGKGTIISHIADGEYNVTLNYDSTGIDAQLAVLNARETLLIEAIATETDELKKKLLRVQLLSVQKRIDYLSDTDHVPVDTNITAWCADLTEDLTGEVGLIEIGREQANGVNIQPGYNANAVYDGDRDGQLVPLMAQTPAATFYNLAMLPGAQKWKPTYLYGVISNIDTATDTADVTLDHVNSSQQSLGIVQAYALTNVPIAYMECNSAAFEEGDRVIVRFKENDFKQPEVIGFEDEPRPCDCLWTEEWNGPIVTTKWAWTEESGATVVYFYQTGGGQQQFDYPLPSNAVSVVLTECSTDPPKAQDCSFITITGREFTLDREIGYPSTTYDQSCTAFYNLLYHTNWINETPVSIIVNCDFNIANAPKIFAVEFVGYLNGKWYFLDVILKNVGDYGEPTLWDGDEELATQHAWISTGPEIYDIAFVEVAGWIQPYGYPGDTTYQTTAARGSTSRILLPEVLAGIKIYEVNIISGSVTGSLTFPAWEVTINHLGVC